MSNRITKITPKNNYVVLTIDEKDKLIVSLDSYLSYSLKKDRELSEDEYNELKKGEDEVLAFEKCLKKFNIKDYTEKQIRDYLDRSYSFSKSQVSSMIDRLVDIGLIDDERYARNRYEAMDSSLYSQRKMAERLKRDGISEDIIEKYVNNEGDREKAIKLAAKYNKSIRNKSVNKKKQSIIQKLVSSGFSYEDANKAIGSLDFAEDKKTESSLVSKEAEKLKCRYIKKYNGIELKKRMYAALISRGFMSDDISRVLNEMRYEDE